MLQSFGINLNIGIIRRKLICKNRDKNNDKQDHHTHYSCFILPEFVPYGGKVALIFYLFSVQVYHLALLKLVLILGSIKA